MLPTINLSQAYQLRYGQGTPIWLGEQSSVCRLMIERLYAMSGPLNDKGQSIFYGKTEGVVITGNEDGAKHVAMNVLYSLSRLGYVVSELCRPGAQPWFGGLVKRVGIRAGSCSNGNG